MANDDNLRESALIWALSATVCLLGVGITFDWTAAVAIVVVGTLLWLGYQLAARKLIHDRLRLQRDRAALAAEWEAHNRTRRIRDTFWNARHAIREEAQRHWPADGPGKGGQ